MICPGPHNLEVSELGFEPRQSSPRNQVLYTALETRFYIQLGFVILPSEQPRASWARPELQKHGEEADKRVGHGAERGRQVIGHRPIGEAGVGLHGGQHAVGECVHEGHQNVDEGQLAWVLGVCFLLWMPLGLDASPRVWGAQVLPFSWPDGVEGDLGGEEVFYGRFPGPGLTLEDKESCEAADHHEGEQEEEDQG